MKKILALAAILTATLLNAQLAQAENFHCSAFPFKSTQAVAAFKKHAHNITMRRILEYQAFNWEDTEMRNICKAASEGKSVNFSCMDGRRDWGAIKASIPDAWFTLGNLELRPEMLALQQQRAMNNPREAALSYCDQLGVISRKVKG